MTQQFVAGTHRQRPAPRMTRVVRTATLAITLASTVAFTAGCSLFPKEVDEPAPVLQAPVKSEKAIYVVKKGDITDEVKLNGRLSAARQQDLYYPNSGRLKAIYVRSGDQVKAGQVLAELHADDIAQSLAQAQIKLQQAQLDLADTQRAIASRDTTADANNLKALQLDVAQAQLDLQHLQQQQAGGDDVAAQIQQAEVRLQKAQLSLATAQAKAQESTKESDDAKLQRAQLNVTAARLDVEKLSQQLKDARLVAPFDGQVMAISGKPGDSLSPYATVISLADPRELIVEADVDDTSLAKLAVGQQARLEFSDLLGNLVGTVVELPDPASKATATSTQPRRIKVKVDGLASQQKAQMGMVGKVRVILQEKKGVLLLANAGLRSFTGRNYVQLSNPRREVDVVLGIAGDTETEIVKGLKEGDQVIGR